MKSSQTIVEKDRIIEGYSADMHQDIEETSIRSSNEWMEDSQNIPREMTVLQAENEENSETD